MEEALRELDAAANRLACTLIAHGVMPGDAVALFAAIPAGQRDVEVDYQVPANSRQFTVPVDEDAPISNIISADPLFVDAANGDLHLKAGSPAIDAGNGCRTFVALSDRAGNSRWDMASVPNTSNALDLGAFEYQGTAEVDTRVTAFSCP